MATSPVLYPTIVETFRGMLPLIRFLNAPLVEAQKARERLERLL